MLVCAVTQVSVPHLTVTQLVAARRGRKILRIRYQPGTTGDQIFIGPTNSVSLANGYPIDATASPLNSYVDLPLEGDVYGINNGTTSKVEALEIYDDGL